MFCKWCGAEISEDAQSCPYCKKDLDRGEKSLIETPTLDNKLEDDFNIKYFTTTSVLHQGMRTKIYLHVEKLCSSQVYGAEVQLSGPPQVDIIIKSRKIHPKKSMNKIFFPISAREPGTFTLTATLTSNAGHRIVLPLRIRVEPTKTLYRGEKREEEPKKTAISSSSATDFMLYLDDGAEAVFLHQSEPKEFSLIVSKLSSSSISSVNVQLSGPPHVHISASSRRIWLSQRIKRVIFSISTEELGIFTLTATLTSDAGHRIVSPIKIRVEPKTFIYGDSPTLISSAGPDYKLYVEGGITTLFLHQDMRSKFYLIVEKQSLSSATSEEIQLSGPPHVDIITKSKKIHATRKGVRILFMISAKELGISTLTATLTSDAGHLIEYAIKIRVEPTDFNFNEIMPAKPISTATRTTTRTTSSSDGAIIARIITGIIGGILFLYAVFLILGVLNSGFGMRDLALGATLGIIGFILFTIATKGECCGDCCTGCCGDFSCPCD